VANYIALIRKDPASDFGVEFPDFPGCVSAGRDLDEARRMAAEALALHIQGMREDGAPLPSPSSLDTIMNDPAHKDAVAFLVDSVGAPPRGMRLNVILPEDLVREIDRTTRNRSRFLAEAAREKLRQSA
jgi:predicted RNase H-like HicB family nuclease